ncbi:hypothetical protein DERF_015878 [Dermatophagoides farinae]|uniref:Uncharacterized protein n=1 Tax=Dermatophagoides farinae TaxID=6954 RepID=A0A922HK41_DERFA|nr:hypothetical protein DERF_015878 [Dermatophagoides farinae]
MKYYFEYLMRFTIQYNTTTKQNKTKKEYRCASYRPDISVNGSPIIKLIPVDKIGKNGYLTGVLV